MNFDLFITEKDGNGGDIQLTGNDLVVVFGIENLPYLSLCGGNKEQSTQTGIVKEQSLDWWANELLFASSPELQMNSETERTFEQVALNSAGRLTIEDAIKLDLKLLKDFGKVSVLVSIISDDRIDTIIKIEADIEAPKIVMITYKKKTDGDFFLFDFNDDFFL